jgi:hypothetical protein
VHRDRIELIEQALSNHIRHEIRVDRRDAAKHARQARRLRTDRLARESAHTGKTRPVRVKLGIPMRFVVGFVPDHGGFDHAATSPTGLMRRAGVRAG